MVKKIVIVALLLLSAFAIINRERIMGFFGEDTRSINKSEVKLLFREDPSLDTLVEVLIEKGVIASDEDFRKYIEENTIDTSNFAAGKYLILSQTQLEDLVTGFLKNEEGNGNAEVKVNVVFNRCKTIEDIGANISQCILADSTAIVDFIKSPETLKKYGFSIQQMPAMFLPKTYELYFDTDAEAFVEFMAAEFKAFWTEERLQKMSNVGLRSQSQVTTVASIVFAEQAKMEEEWPIIARLYLNRVNKGMRLESDPTFKFCWGDELDGVERLLNKHKAIDCPYNTYLYDGLPPGPICIPPAEVIDAVLNPADVNYLFMCGKPGGQGHNFAVTNAGHEKNVAVYRKWLKKYLEDKEN